MKFLVFGSLNIDHVYQLDHLMREGETVSARQYDALAGGKGLNQAIALARSGQETWFAGAVGNDGLFLKELLETSGIHTENLSILPCPSGHAVIQVDKEGRNSIIVYGGANHQITPETVDAVLEHFNPGDWLLMQNEISSGEYLLSRAAQTGMHVALNPSPDPGKTKEWPLEKVDWLIFNEIEGQELSSQREPDMMLDALLKRYPDDHLVLTLGEAGAIYADRKQRICQPAIPTNAVDTTAAGDTFTGYFLSSVANGTAPGQALRIAATAASISVSRPGATLSVPYYDEVHNFFC